jgi:hypothetical protein
LYSAHHFYYLLCFALLCFVCLCSKTKTIPTFSLHVVSEAFIYTNSTVYCTVRPMPNIVVSSVIYQFVRGVRRIKILNREISPYKRNKKLRVSGHQTGKLGLSALQLRAFTRAQEQLSNNYYRGIRHQISRALLFADFSSVVRYVFTFVAHILSFSIRALVIKNTTLTIPKFGALAGIIGECTCQSQGWRKKVCDRGTTHL